MTDVLPGQAGDVPGLVAIHTESFAGFFLTSLGTKFLTRFYEALVHEPDCICLVAKTGGRLVGFAVGPLEPARFFRRLFMRQGIGFAMDAARALLRRPREVGGRLIRAVRYRGDAPPHLHGAALLSSIAVRPDAAGAGIAGRLLEEFCRRATDRGAAAVYLTTDRDDNAAVNRFYVRHGFQVESVLVRPDGRAMHRYVRPLALTSAGVTASEDARDE